MKQLKKYRVNLRITEAEWIELHQQKGSITEYIKQGKLQCAIIVKENLLLNSNVKDNIGSMEA
jgi:hypothetical protein